MAGMIHKDTKMPAWCQRTVTSHIKAALSSKWPQSQQFHRHAAASTSATGRNRRKTPQTPHRKAKVLVRNAGLPNKY